MLAEKIATAIALGPANTRVRDTYTLIGAHPPTHADVREALVATADHRGTGILALSSVVGNLAELRGRTYVASRAGLGRSGSDLPADFNAVVTVVATFADRLADENDEALGWNPNARRWER